MARASVCVFCGSSPGRRPAYAEVAAAVGRALAERGTTVVYGGGAVGLMGILADAALAAGGRVVGVIPASLWDKEVGHGGLSELHVVATMHERKALMAERSDASLCLPGGFGTFEELCEVLTWAQLGLHAKPTVLLDVEGFFGPFFALADRAVEDGFLRPEHRELARRATTLGDALALLDEPLPAPRPKWIDLEDL